MAKSLADVLKELKNKVSVGALTEEDNITLLDLAHKQNVYTDPAINIDKTLTDVKKMEGKSNG